MEKDLVSRYKDRLTNSRAGGNCGPISEMDVIRKKQSRWPSKRLSRRETMLIKLANMRAAKERKRIERGNAGLLEWEPKFLPYYPLELGIKDKQTGEIAWIDFKSVRDAAKRLSIIQKYYIS